LRRVTATSSAVLKIRPVCLFSSPPLNDEDCSLPGAGQRGVQEVALEQHVVALADHHDHVVPLGALGTMAGDGIRQLELRPVLALVLDEALALHPGWDDHPGAPR
jgi:hypothetical protein